MSGTRTYVPLRDVANHRPWATERYCRRLVAERRVAFTKVGARVLIALEDLDALTEAGRIDPRNFQ
jgi:excisionase family DNA binding protein